MQIKNLTKGTIVAHSCKIADNFISRFLGLMGKKGLPQGSGLLIVPCNSIHMFFMEIPLDIVFIDKDNTVIHIINNIRPWEYSKIIWKAHSVLELPSGTIHSSNTETGDRLAF